MADNSGVAESGARRVQAAGERWAALVLVLVTGAFVAGWRLRRRWAS